MAKSTKAKREKQKDFQKPKLKVGKGKTKASNFTDTSFRARSISVLQQSLTTQVPGTQEQFNRHLDLLTHRNEGHRQQSLAYICNVLQSHPTSSPQPPAIIIAKVQPLVRDTSPAVRLQLLKLLKSLPSSDIRAHTEGLLLWIRLGITNLDAPMRINALDILEWLCEAAGDEVVSCAGGWAKTLRCFAGVLGWETGLKGEKTFGKTFQNSAKPWTSTSSTSIKSSLGSKLLQRTLAVLTVFLRTGLSQGFVPSGGNVATSSIRAPFPLLQYVDHALIIHTDVTNPFGSLSLFNAVRDEENIALEGREDRSEYFEQRWRQLYEQGISKMLRDGGGVGRAALALAKVLKCCKDHIDELSII